MFKICTFNITQENNNIVTWTSVKMSLINMHFLNKVGQLDIFKLVYFMQKIILVKYMYAIIVVFICYRTVQTKAITVYAALSDNCIK